MLACRWYGFRACVSCAPGLLGSSSCQWLRHLHRCCSCLRPVSGPGQLADEEMVEGPRASHLHVVIMFGCVADFDLIAVASSS